MNNLVLDNNISVEVSRYSFDNALLLWADSSTDIQSDRRKDLLRDKAKQVSDFFNWICKPVHEITPNDIKSWQNELENRGLSPNSVYGHHLSILFCHYTGKAGEVVPQK